jgi:hypothetical protein
VIVYSFARPIIVAPMGVVLRWGRLRAG